MTDAASFTAFYWAQQFTTAGLLIVVTTLGGLGGAAAYGAHPRTTAAPAPAGPSTTAA